MLTLFPILLLIIPFASLAHLFTPELLLLHSQVPQDESSRLWRSSYRATIRSERGNIDLRLVSSNSARLSQSGNALCFILRQRGNRTRHQYWGAQAADVPLDLRVNDYLVLMVFGIEEERRHSLRLFNAVEYPDLVTKIRTVVRADKRDAAIIMRVGPATLEATEYQEIQPHSDQSCLLMGFILMVAAFIATIYFN